MTRRERLRTRVVADQRGQRAIVSPHTDPDIQVASGEWVATDTLVPARR